MPTVDIPDKICSHCGGIRWIQYPIVKKSAKTGEIKTYTGLKCAKKNIESGDRWRKNNIEHYRKVARERIQNKRKTCIEFIKRDRERKKMYYKVHKEERDIYKKKWISLNHEKYLGYCNKNAKKQMENLTDYYVSRAVIGKKSILKRSDVTPEVIELKRKQLLLTRKIKNNGKIQKTISSGS